MSLRKWVRLGHNGARAGNPRKLYEYIYGVKTSHSNNFSKKQMIHARSHRNYSQTFWGPNRKVSQVTWLENLKAKCDKSSYVGRIRNTVLGKDFRPLYGTLATLNSYSHMPRLHFITFRIHSMFPFITNRNMKKRVAVPAPMNTNQEWKWSWMIKLKKGNIAPTSFENVCISNAYSSL
jgi:hypothetical protein